MPLIKKPGKAARQANIETEIAAGRPVKQAVAIGYSTEREARRKKPKVGRRAVKGGAITALE